MSELARRRSSVRTIACFCDACSRVLYVPEDSLFCPVCSSSLILTEQTEVITLKVSTTP